MRYHYYVQAFNGKPLRCPPGHSLLFFQILQELTGYDPGTARKIMMAGMVINARATGKKSLWYCKFYALPARALEVLLTDGVTLTAAGNLQ
jgi:hypothetical protein